MSLSDIMEADKADVEDVIDAVGFGRVHVILYLIIGLFTAADSIEVCFLSYVTQVLKEPWNLTPMDEAMMECMVFIGQIAGAPLWGYLADRFGRRPIFLTASFLITSCGVGTAMVMSVPQLILVRFFVGVGVAGLSVPFDIFAEMLPSHLRGKLLLSTFFWFSAGALYTTFSAWLTMCTAGWRWFTVMCALPTLVATIFGIALLPESPHWLAANGRGCEAAAIMNKIAQQNKVPTKLTTVTVAPTLEMLRTRDLFRHAELRRPFFSIFMAWFGFGVGFYGISLMLPHLFVEETVASLSNEASDAGARLLGAMNDCGSETFDFMAIAKSNAGQIIGLAVGVGFIDLWGRKPVQMLGYGLSGICVLGLGFPNILGKDMILAVTAVSIAAQMAASCTTWTHTAELFPTNVRGAANAICNAGARFGAALSTFVIGDLVPMFPTAIILAAVCFLSVIGVAGVKETAGRSLENPKIVPCSESLGETQTPKISVKRHAADSS